MKTFIYNDEQINLGEIGEHELVINALNLSHPGEEPKIVIMSAKALVRFPGCLVQELDVSPIVRECPDWLDRVRKDFNKRRTA